FVQSLENAVYHGGTGVSPVLAVDRRDAGPTVWRHRRHRIILVVQRDIVEVILRHLLVHTPDTVAQDDGQFVGEGRIVANQVRHGRGEEMTVAILMLKSFAVECGPTSGSAEQEAARPHVGGGPDQIADALEAEHRVVDEKRNGRYAVRGISGAGGD